MLLKLFIAIDVFIVMAILFYFALIFLPFFGGPDVLHIGWEFDFSGLGYGY